MMANIKDIIGEEAFNTLSEEKKKELIKKDFEDISDGAFVPKVKFEQVSDQAKEYKRQVGERDKQISGLKEQYKDVEGLKEKIGILEQDNKTQKETYEKQLADISFNNALDAAMGKYTFQDGAKDIAINQIKGNVKFEDGKLIGFTEAMADIEKNKAYLLKTTPNGTGSFSTGGGEHKENTNVNFATELGKQRAESLKAKNLTDFAK